ncbi:MAG TPA: hypothetical protein VEH86_04780 [Candidatus Acidoferrum sp.]|nr:hypothetical protein [Candidatus Acidoferrum sp.]
MKFSDVIVATVSLVLFGLLLNGFLLVAFGSLSASSTSDTLASIISFLVASLVVGHVFALKIQDESRIKAIGVVVVLSAFALLIFTSIWMATPFAYNWEQDFLNSMFNRTTQSWSHYDLNAYAALAGSIEVIMGIVISFIGLYAGSMLRKPSTKTKE